MKCPHNMKSKDDESSYRERSGWKIKSNFRKSNFKKISLSKSNLNEDLEEEFSESLFMAFEEKKSEMKQKLEEEINEEVEIEVNLEGELIIALEELEIERKRYKKNSYKFNDTNEIIIRLKVLVEEMEKITKDLEEQLTTKVEYYSKLEAEIIGSSLQLEEISHKISGYHKVEGGSLKLDEILKSQRLPNIKFGLGFEEG